MKTYLYYLIVFENLNAKPIKFENFWKTGKDLSQFLIEIYCGTKPQISTLFNNFSILLKCLVQVINFLSQFFLKINTKAKNLGFYQDLGLRIIFSIIEIILIDQDIFV